MILLSEETRRESEKAARRVEHIQLATESDFQDQYMMAMITKQMLADMTIDEDNKLYDQVFWIDRKKCLRPMLAPNLYVVMRELKRITNGPVKIYEIGSCFRKESQGAKHINEFTMMYRSSSIGTT